MSIGLMVDYLTHILSKSMVRYEKMAFVMTPSLTMTITVFSSLLRMRRRSTRSGERNIDNHGFFHLAWWAFDVVGSGSFSIQHEWSLATGLSYSTRDCCPGTSSWLDLLASDTLNFRTSVNELEATHKACCYLWRHNTRQALPSIAIDVSGSIPYRFERICFASKGVA